MKTNEQLLMGYVCELNMDYCEKVKNSLGKDTEYSPFEFQTNGFAYSVTFFGNSIYCSENDKEFDDDNNSIAIQELEKNLSNLLLELKVYTS
jgi:hypothetical protein